ncbi:MAG: polyprenyl synthetase family protein [Phycisphaerales bacterium]|nr:polyprenyl synthetase family protein [Phycisphaerales bacterium]MCB9836814.1 polyprenyl synthetase family protein [Phycisphaera sp.]
MLDRPGHGRIVLFPRRPGEHGRPNAKDRDISTISDNHKAALTRIEAELERLIGGAGLGGDLSAGLREAMAYAVLGGGKRLRPLLVWLACEAVGGDAGKCLPAAAAVEFVHAFSLVHDDLPAMDDDDLRRGRPTLHVHTNEAMAILAGDALLNLAFAALLESDASDSARVALVQELTRGCAGMISGQVYDTMPGLDPEPDDRRRLERIHVNKTGALIRASARMGAICGGANTEQLEALTAYADAVGHMFQAVDDLLDVEQSAEQIGKRTGKDAQAGKLTYPGLLGVDGTRAEVARLLGEAERAIAVLDERGATLGSIARQMALRDR